ncbi:UNVERIFIED_CONTAM: movement protein [Sesamum calycinum]|uniref:Movement protein n=1 Tax=Sesamum calycinum TaxID=2727403 RepID=A0AAW2P976_9LAMI
MMFDIHPRIAYNLADQDFSRVLTLHQNFKRKDLMKEGNRPYSITYRIAYALYNTHHSDLFLRKEYIEIPIIFKEFAKVMAPDPIRIPRIGGVDIVIKDHPVLDRTISSRTEFSSRMSFSEDRIMGYKGKEKDLLKALTPQEIRQPVVGRYEGMLEIPGHEILVAGVAGRENGSMTLGLSFLEDHKPWGRKGNGSGICTAKLRVFPKEARETLLVIAGRDFSQKILILNTGIREAKIMIGGAFGTPWFRVKTPPIYFHGTGVDILLVRYSFAKRKGISQDNAYKFSQQAWQQGLIDSDSFYEESEKEIKNLKEALQELKTMDISEESKLSLENVKRLIQRNFSENPLAWWIGIRSKLLLRLKRNADMSIFIKDLAKYRKDFRPLLKETESAKWKWEEIHTQRVRELKQVCNNLSKLAIPQDEDELVVYTDANNYKWAAVLMKLTTTGEEPCRYTGGCSPNNKPKCGTSTRKNSLQFGRRLKNGLYFYLLKNLL